MFEHFYTTKMSASKKALQKRFTKIRSGQSRFTRLMAITATAAVLAATICATVVMAAVGSGGLENQTQDEVYFIAAMKSKIQVDLANMPGWIKEISSDGMIDMEIDYLNTRLAKTYEQSGGNVQRSLTAKFSGNQGETKIEDGLNATVEERSYTFCNFAQGDKAFVLWMPLNERGEITSYRVCFTTADSDDLAYSHTNTHKENFMDLPAGGIQFVGDFQGILKQTDYFTMPDYFTVYEKNFRNYDAEGIDIGISDISAEGISIKTDVFREEPDTLKINIRPKAAVLAYGWSFTKKLEEINHKEIRFDEDEFKTIYMYYFFDFNSWLASGDEYVIDFILLKTDESSTAEEAKGFPQTVLYRQREYVTIP